MRVGASQMLLVYMASGWYEARSGFGTTQYRYDKEEK